MRTLVGARIVTPGDWADLDLDPATRHTSIAHAVRRAVARDPHLEGNAVRLIAILDDIVKRAVDSGAFFCSSLVLGSVRDPLVANVLMQITSDDDAPGPLFSSGEEICAGLAAAVSCDPEWAGADVSVVPLPLVGPAVRAELVAGGVCLQYLVPVPVPAPVGAAASVAVPMSAPVPMGAAAPVLMPTAEPAVALTSPPYVLLTFTSPCPPYVAALIELFDQMAASFALDYADDEAATSQASAG